MVIHLRTTHLELKQGVTWTQTHVEQIHRMKTHQTWIGPRPMNHETGSLQGTSLLNLLQATPETAGKPPHLLWGNSTPVGCLPVV